MIPKQTPVRLVLSPLFLLLLISLVACGQDAPDAPTASSTAGPDDPATPTADTAATAGESGGTATEAAETPVTASDPPAPTATATPELTPTMEPISVARVDGSETTMAPLPPAGYLELLQRQVEAGAWTEADGIIQLLKVLAGELDREQLPPNSDVISHSATGLVRHAHDVAQDPTTDDADRAEIERLLNSLTPSQEALDLYSEPESAPESMQESTLQSNAGSNRWMRLGRRQSQADQCADLAADGFPTDDVDGFPCFVYRQTELNGFQYRVYYPKDWQTQNDERKLGIVDTAMTALTESAQTFAQLATIEDVNIIFSLRPYQGDNRLAHQTVFDLDDPCPITLFPSANAGGSGSFMQTVAHEVFHCVQDWNFTTSPYAQHRWWLEGSAEYFSNVVYPASNDEHRFLESFNIQSLSNSLMEMSYHNFIFFQYLGNQIGDAPLITLLENMSAAGGTGAQAQVLAGHGDMSGLFQDFVVSYLSEGIPDTGGGAIAVEHPAAIGTEPIDEEGVQEYEAGPFVAVRFAVRYAQEKRFLQEAQPGADGRHSMVDNTQRRNKSAWSDVPPEVRSSCDDDSVYALAVTTVNNDYTLDIDVGTVETAECDPCLLGAWEVDHQSFNEYIARIAADVPQANAVSFNMEVTGGQQLVQFMEDGEMLTARDAFQLTMSSPEAPPVVSTTDGHGSGEYTADGEQLTFRNVVQVIDQTHMTVNGVPIEVTSDMQTTDVTIFGQTTTVDATELGSTETSGQGEYTCTDETLTITMQDYGDIEFDRVDELLPTPVPTPGP